MLSDTRWSSSTAGTDVVVMLLCITGGMRAGASIDLPSAAFPERVFLIGFVFGTPSVCLSASL